ncbi:hypothetical protein [Thermoanaerobacterium sp. DL9XJH110]|uniref:hypothetical protein n=1 Tax=Thermoanaerobacterium sp. DL9XJH110 TaxID=3386643 RepID=UPI003BB65A9F
MSKKNSMQDRAIKHLRSYLWFGGVYLAGAAIWFVISFIKQELDTPVAFIWLTGSAAYISGITLAVRRINQIKSGKLEVWAAEPDERKEFITAKAANGAFWWTILILFAILGGETGQKGKIPADISAILLTEIILYFAHYIYYIRKY